MARGRAGEGSRNGSAESCGRWGDRHAAGAWGVGEAGAPGQGVEGSLGEMQLAWAQGSLTGSVRCQACRL